MLRFAFSRTKARRFKMKVRKMCGFLNTDLWEEHDSNMCIDRIISFGKPWPAHIWMVSVLGKKTKFLAFHSLPTQDTQAMTARETPISRIQEYLSNHTVNGSEFIHQLSHEKNPPTLHYTGWLIGILIMVYYNPHIFLGRISSPI